VRTHGGLSINMLFTVCRCTVLMVFVSSVLISWLRRGCSKTSCVATAGGPLAGGHCCQLRSFKVWTCKVWTDKVHKVNKALINIMADDSNCRPIALHDGFATMESAIARIEAYMASIYHASQHGAKRRRRSKTSTRNVESLNAKSPSLQKTSSTTNLYSVSQKNPPPEIFWHFFPNGWEFFVQILHAYYMFLSTLDSLSLSLSL